MGCMQPHVGNGDVILPEIHNPENTQIANRPSIIINRKTFICAKSGNISDFYDIKHEIGSGSYSVVYKAVHKETGQERAVKTINKSAIEDSSTQLSEEVEILKELDHPNIIKIFEIYEDDAKLHIVTELCRGPELFAKIVACESFSENQAAIIMYQILSGLITTHEAGIAHRDLKPENLIFLDNSDDSPLKLIDFGISQKIKNGTKLASLIGTAYYMAPEVIDGDYDYRCDIWSAGVILYTLLSGSPPFNASTDSQILQKISRGVFGFSGSEWGHISRDAKSLIKKMLTKSVDQRISAQDAFNDPWIQSRAHGLVEDRLLNEDTLGNLVQFRNRNKLQQATMSFIASHLVSNQEIDELRKMFVSLDSNGDGKLNVGELRRGFIKFPNLSNMNIEDILVNCDMDNNGFLDYNEFLTAALS